MRDPAFNGSIEVVRGHLSDDRAAQLLEFWSTNTALGEAAARQRLDEVVCVLLGGAGEIVGVNSVYPDSVGLIGGRRFWIYRSFLLPVAANAGPRMISAAFAALEEDFDPVGDGPIGLCILIGDRANMTRRPDAEWSDPRTLYAGYLADGRQVRIAYFADAKIYRGSWEAALAGHVPDPDPQLEEGYRIDPFGEQDAVSEQSVIDLWAREGVVSPHEAKRRASEVLLVATEAGGEPVGVSSAYLQRNQQLRMDLWHYRAFVADAHRKSNVAQVLARTGRDHLQHRFVTGRDVRAPGILYEVENEGLKRHSNGALWPRLDFIFIGENPRGDHVRVHYFPGALAPEPPR